MSSFFLRNVVFSSLFLIPSLLSLSVDDRRQLLDIHNKLRDRVAGGGLISSGHPAATDMNALIWDAGLEKVAQDYADSCPSGHNGYRGINYLAERNANNTKWGPDYPQQYLSSFCDPDGPSGSATAQDCIYIGENLIRYSAGSDPSISQIVSDIETGWFDEYQWWTYSNQSCNAPAGKSCGHYTQMVWANTRYLGCAYSTNCTNDIVVCNYFPAGNFNSHINHPYDDAATSADICTNCMGDRTVCFSSFVTGGYDALCGYGTCPTICDGGSYDRATCNNGNMPSGCTIDCNDGTTSLTAGRDVCVTPHPTQATSSPTPKPTDNPTAPTTAAPTPAGPPSCLDLTGSVWTSTFGNSWSKSSADYNNKPAYTRSSGYYLEWNSVINRYVVTNAQGGNTIYIYCDASITDVTNCDDGDWYYWTGSAWAVDTGAAISTCSSSAQANDESKQSLQYIPKDVSVADNDNSVDKMVFNMTEMHIILCLLVVVLVTLCAMMIGFCCYIRRKNKNENKSDDDANMQMVYFEGKDTEENNNIIRGTPSRGTPIGEDNNNVNTMKQATLSININDKKLMKKIQQTTPVTPLMEDEQYDDI